MNSERVGDPGRELALLVSPGPGDAVLWIHGYTMDVSVWRELWDRLPGWTHLGVDLPGHGASDPMRPDEDLGALGRRLAALALARDVCHVVGLSFGSMIALQLAIEQPGAFRTLTLAAPTLGGGPEDPHARARHLTLLELYRDRGPGPWLADLWFTWPPDIFKGASAHPALWELLRRVVARHAWAELGDGAMEVLSTTVQPDGQMGRIRAATLVLVGEEDMAAFKRSAELIRRAIPDCRRRYVPAAGHLCLLEAPDTVAPWLDAQFRGTPAVPGGLPQKR